MKIRALIGTFFIVISLAFFGLSGWVMYLALDKQRANDDVTRRAEITCREQLVRIASTVAGTEGGSRVTPLADGVIDVDFGDVRSDPRRALSDASMILAACPTKILQEVCLGAGCVGANPNNAVRLMVKLAPLKNSPR